MYCEKDVEKIDLGKVVLLKKEGYWDFYQEKEEYNLRITRERFDEVNVKGYLVYVTKMIGGFPYKGLYTCNAEEKIALTSSFIDCGSTLLVKENSDKYWDFYTKEGERITHESFLYVSVIGDLVRVAKEKVGESLKCGVYNTKAKEVIPLIYKDIYIENSILVKAQAEIGEWFEITVK